MTLLLASLGRAALEVFRYVGGLTHLAQDALYWTFIAPWKGKGLRWRSSIHQMVIVGFNSLPIVMVIGFFIGVILALQGANELKRFGAMRFVVNLVAVSMTRELGPLITAIIVAGRSGSAFAAELGTMKVSEEIDALQTMGLNPTKFLVVPKLLATMIMLPCLTTMSDLSGILGCLVFSSYEMGMSVSAYFLAVQDALQLNDLFTGLIKSMVFALLITKIGCYEGFCVTGGAEGVGKATTSSVVKAIFTIILADLVFTAIFYYTGSSM
jgi:phospholipid/cholesterol/gamma-HCH transport system permease protein